MIALIEFAAKQRDLFGYVVFTYTFHLWGKDKAEDKDKIPGK